jgi:hypothetical protein
VSRPGWPEAGRRWPQVAAVTGGERRRRYGPPGAAGQDPIPGRPGRTSWAALVVAAEAATVVQAAETVVSTIVVTGRDVVVPAVASGPAVLTAS